MKKKFLSTLLLSAVLVTSSVQAFASTPQHNLVQASTNLSNNIVNSNNKPISIDINGDIETRTYSNNEIVRLNKADGDVDFTNNGKWYTFNRLTDYVGYNKPNKFSAVLFAQTRFNDIIGAGLAEDGKFGSATHSVTETYQRTRGLPVDCIIGPNTWQYLIDYK